MTENDILWEGVGDISRVRLQFADDKYTDSVTGAYLDGENEEILELQITINGSSFSIYPENINDFREYCRDPANTPKDSWIYPDPDIITPEPCFRCNSDIENVEESLLFTMWGDKTGMHIFCSDCSYKLYEDLEEVPVNEILSRKI